MHRTSFGLAISFAVGAVLLLAPTPGEGQRASRLERQTVNGRDVVAREVLVKFRPGVQPAGLRGDRGGHRRPGRAANRPRRHVSPSIEIARAPPRCSRGSPAAPTSSTPSRTSSSRSQRRRTIPAFPELLGARDDIHATPAWDLSVGSTSNVVAVIDTGIDYTHEDLAANVWSAPTASRSTSTGSRSRARQALTASTPSPARAIRWTTTITGRTSPARSARSGTTASASSASTGRPS